VVGRSGDRHAIHFFCTGLPTATPGPRRRTTFRRNQRDTLKLYGGGAGQAFVCPELVCSPRLIEAGCAFRQLDPTGGGGGTGRDHHSEAHKTRERPGGAEAQPDRASARD